MKCSLASALTILVACMSPNVLNAWQLPLQRAALNPSLLLLCSIDFAL
jgi:hypothetical protein